MFSNEKAAFQGESSSQLGERIRTESPYGFARNSGRSFSDSFVEDILRICFLRSD